MSNFDEIKKTPDESEDLPTDMAEDVVDATDQKPKKTLKLAKFNWRSNRKLRLGATATAITVVVVAVVVLINIICGVLADRFPWTLDLTADQTYSLSEDSRALAQALSSEVAITVLAGEDYFSQPNTGTEEYDTILRQFYLFTEEYKTLSNGKVTTSYVDLEKNPTLSASFEEKYQATSGNILFICGDQYRMITLDDLLQQDVDYTTYSYTITSLVEQKLASNISSVCGGKAVTVTFLTGHDEDETAIAALKKLYELNGYYTQTLDFTTAQAISDTTGAIAIVGPAKDYTVDEIKRLRNWLNNDGNLGRNLFVFASYAGTCPNLYDFLSVDYGITVTQNIIMETDSNNYPMDFYGSYPYRPLTTITSSDLTGTIAGQKVIMPLTLQLLTAKDSNTDKNLLTNHTVVSFPESSRLTALSDLLAAESDDDIVQVEADEYPLIGMAYARNYDVINNESVETYVVVSGSCQFADYVTSSQYENESLAIEPLRTMCSLGDTVVISGKDLSADTLSFSSLTAQVMGLGVFTLGIPLVLIIVCLVVFFKRRHL